MLVKGATDIHRGSTQCGDRRSLPIMVTTLNKNALVIGVERLWFEHRIFQSLSASENKFLNAVKGMATFSLPIHKYFMIQHAQKGNDILNINIAV